MLAEALQRAHVALPPGQPAAPLPSPKPFAYRYRLRLHLDRKGRMGFHRRASNQVVPIRRCLLVHEQLNQVMARLVDFDWPQKMRTHVQALELLLCPASGRTIVVLEPRQRRRSTNFHIPADSASSPADLVVLATQPSTRGELSPGATALLAQSFNGPRKNYQLSWDHRCFFQVNIAQNTRLVQQALALLSPRSRPWSALDLFCGMGTFSIPLALAGARVTGVEHNRHSLHWAERNNRAAGLQGTRFITADVRSQLETMVAGREAFTSILLDPPRQGLGRTAALLPRLEPEQIIYVSCDPATLARDLGLITAGGYRVQQVIPVDMFPQTHHIESVTLLERN
nr:methyltransferase domain-containing protein [Desulfobulbus alkaliphilus]